MRQGGDAGQPVVVQDADSELASKFYEVAANLTGQLGA
jgi:hypothetical protein